MKEMTKNLQIIRSAASAHSRWWNTPLKLFHEQPIKTENVQLPHLCRATQHRPEPQHNTTWKAWSHLSLRHSAGSINVISQITDDDHEIIIILWCFALLYKMLTADSSMSVIGQMLLTDRVDEQLVQVGEDGEQKQIPGLLKHQLPWRRYHGYVWPLTSRRHQQEGKNIISFQNIYLHFFVEIFSTVCHLTGMHERRHDWLKTVTWTSSSSSSSSSWVSMSLLITEK